MSLLEVIPGPSIDAIFQAFDGHDYDIDGASRRVEVCGIHDDGLCKWVQLAVDGPEPRILTVRLAGTGPASLISKVN